MYIEVKFQFSEFLKQRFAVVTICSFNFSLNSLSLETETRGKLSE